MPKGHDILSTLGSNFTMTSTLKMINNPKVVFDLPIIKIVMLIKRDHNSIVKRASNNLFSTSELTKKFVAHHSFNYDITHEPGINHNLGDKTEVETGYVLKDNLV